MTDANIARKAAIRLLKNSLDSVRIEAGFLIKGYRGYKRPGKQDGLKQDDVEEKTGFKQEYLSSLENGKTIPDDVALKKVLKVCGFDLNAPGGKAFFKLLCFIRDSESDLAKLQSEKPK